MRLIEADALKENGTVIAIVNGQKMKVVPLRCIDNAPTIKTYTLADIEKQYRKGLEKGLSEWETERPTGVWIPVNERLPEDGRNVLLCDIDNDIMVGYHVKGSPNTHFSQDGTYEDMKNVMAWMPLPEAYKKGAEE